MEEELAEVVDGVRDESSNTEVIRTRLSVGLCEGVEVDACKIEEGVFVVGSEFCFDLG